MKIVNRKEFLALPEGILFSEYEPCIFTDLIIKQESTLNDYFEMTIIGNIKCSDSGKFSEILENARLNKISFKLDFNYSMRNGLFDEEQLYAVYEREDILGLIDELKKCLTAEE